MEAAIMSRTLNLTECLLERGRFLQNLGRTHDAMRVFGRLAGLRELPAAMAEETQIRLAEMHLRQHEFAQARRHLTAALIHNPNNARYHYLLAAAHDQDEKGDPQSAFKHFRQSLELDPNQPRCLSEYGIVALCLGHNEAGLKALRRGVDLAPDDPDTVAKLVEGLCLAEQPAEARLALRAALFRNPRHPQFRKLWNDFQWDELYEEQEAQREANRSVPEDDEPALLPYVPRETSAPVVDRGRKRIRHDGPSAPLPPHSPRRNQLPGRRHA
jgi:tetratricopeptide (TPR) repeat protein